MNRKTIAIVAGAVALAALLFFLTRSEDTENTKSNVSAAKSGQPASSLGPPTIHNQPKASIAGQVVDQDGAAVLGARVCASASSPKLADEDDHDLNCVLSVVGGSYSFGGLVPARYTVSASARGFIASTFEYPSEKDPDTPEDSFELEAGEDRKDVNLVLTKGGVEVKGVVKDIGGGVVPGAWVSVSKGWSFGFGFRSSNSGSADAVTTSAEDGTFSVWVAEGTIAASAQVQGYADGSASGIAPGQLIEIIMTPESVLAGRVVSSSTGKPIARALVEAGSSGWFANGGSARTDEDGNFRITRLSPGRYKPDAQVEGAYGVAAESVLLGLGQTREDILIKVHPAFVVSGVVTIEGDDSPCEEASVRLKDDVAQHSEWAEYDKKTGLIEFEAVLPGDYEVSVQCEGYVPESEYANIKVSDQDVKGLTWSVRSGETLVGRVVTQSGQLVADASIWARTVGGDPRAQRGGGSGESDEEGRFSIEGLLVGEYSVEAGAEGYLSPEDAPKVEVQAGSLAEIEIVLEDGGSIGGVVVDENDEPILGARIRARSALGGWRSGGQTSARDDGTFTMKSLRPGEYRVSASKGVWGGKALMGLGKGDDDVQGELAVVAVGKTAQVKLVVQSQKGTITGTVVDEQGKPVSDAFIDSQRQSQAAGASKSRARSRVRWGQRWSKKLTLTDMDGRFTLSGLGDGRYTLLAYRKGGGEALAEDVELGGDVILTIRSTGSLAGQVTIADGGIPTEFSVSISDDETGFRRSEEFYRTEGVWALHDLPAGEYKVHVEASEGTAEKKAVPLGEAEDRTGIDIVLESRATVTGQLIALESGDPVPGMSVSVSPEGAARFSFGGGGDKQHISDAEGRFVVEGAPTGRVRISAFPTDWENAEFSFVRMVTTVAAGKSTDIGALRIPKARIKLGKGGAGDLGFTLQQREGNVEPEDVAFQVALVRPDGPAAKTGLEVGDVITEVDGHDVQGLNSYLYRTLTKVAPGVSITLKLKRGDTVKIVAAKPR